MSWFPPAILLYPREQTPRRTSCLLVFKKETHSVFTSLSRQAVRFVYLSLVIIHEHNTTVLFCYVHSPLGAGVSTLLITRVKCFDYYPLSELIKQTRKRKTKGKLDRYSCTMVISDVIRHASLLFHEIFFLFLFLPG